MSVTRSGPNSSTQPLESVDFPAPESPTRVSMMGRPARNGMGNLRLVATNQVREIIHKYDRQTTHLFATDVRASPSGWCSSGQGPDRLGHPPGRNLSANESLGKPISGCRANGASRSGALLFLKRKTPAPPPRRTVSPSSPVHLADPRRPHPAGAGASPGAEA